MPDSFGDKLDMAARQASWRVLQAITLRRQAKVAVLASTALSIVAAARPGILPPDLLAIQGLLNVGAINALLTDVASGKESDDEKIAARMEALLPAGEALAELKTNQKDLLRILTRQYTWQRQMLRLQREDAAAAAKLLTGFAEMTGDLAAIRDELAQLATKEQLDDLLKLIRDEVLPNLSPAVRDQYNIAGDVTIINTLGGGYVAGNVQAGGDVILGSQTIQGDLVKGDKIINWPKDTPYQPPAPPLPGELPRPDLLPPGSYMPFARNALFTGRGEEMLALAAQLLPQAGDAAAPATRSALVTSGIGGVGKSQLAVEFAYRYGRFFHGVHWVSAENPDAVAAAVADCGRRMGLHPAFGELPLADQVALTERAWAGPETRLVILDNCEETETLARWRPKGGGARLLVTSRNPTWPVEYGVAALAVDPFPRPESRALLREYLDPAGRQEADEALDRVAAEVGDLPLALALAGHYLARYKRVTVDEYLAEVRRADELLPIGRGAVSLTKHDLSVRSTFAVSFNKLDFDDLVDMMAFNMLGFAACLAPGEPLPDWLLAAPADTNMSNSAFVDNILDEMGRLGLIESQKSETADEAASGITADDVRGLLQELTNGEVSFGTIIDDAFYRLLELGLLERAGETSYKLHRLVARFVDETQPPETTSLIQKMVEKAVISRTYEQNQAGDPRPLRAWEVHLRHVVDVAFEREDENAAPLCNNFGYYLKMSGDLAGARPYLERALAIDEKVLGTEHPGTATDYNNLGSLLQDMGDLAGARPYYERALAIRERVLGPEHPLTASAVNNLGSLLYAMGDLAGARPYFERALAINERVLGPEHPLTASAVNNLGSLLQDMGDLAGAQPYFERALAIDEKVLGTEHPGTATDYNNLGSLLQDMGDLAGARPYLERALAINERVLGPEHPLTASAVNNLGSLLQDMGDLAGARPYLERALAIDEKVLGTEHPGTATDYNNLGSLLQDMGDLAGARPYYERALAIRERVLGPEHPLTASAVNNLGSLLYAMGDLAGARPYFERALAIRERVLGPEHPLTASAVNNLGLLLQDMGDLAGARPYYERALAIRERVLGPEHPDTAQSLNNMGSLLRAMGDLAGARTHYERALAIRERVLGPEHPLTASAVNNLGSLLQAMGDLAGARPYYERALAIAEKTLGPDHPQTAGSLNNLGGLLYAMGDLAGTRPYLERALAIFEAKLGPDHPNTRIVRNNLARLS